MCVGCKNKKCAKRDKFSFHRVLVAVDESPQSKCAVQKASEIAKAFGARLALVHAFTVVPSAQERSTPYGTVDTERREVAKELLERHKARVPATIHCEEFCVEDDAVPGILDTAEDWGADLIVIGTHGRGRLAQLLLGSTAEAVVRRAKCAVLTVSQEPEPVAAATCHTAATAGV